MFRSECMINTISNSSKSLFPIQNIIDYEDKGVEYFIKDPEIYRDKKVVIAGGGDSALDWAIYLADVAEESVKQACL